MANSLRLLLMAVAAFAAFAALAPFAAADTPPNVTLIQPADGSVLVEGNKSFECMASDNANLKSLALFGNWSGTFEVIETRFNPKNSSNQKFEVHLPRGTFRWDCLAVDSGDQSAFANKSHVLTMVRAVFSATPAPQVFNRITLDCPSFSLNASGRITVSNYKQNVLSCTGFGISAKYANGTALPEGSLQDRGCEANRPRYDLVFPSQGDFLVFAQSTTPGVNASCTISYRGLASRGSQRRVPDFNPLLAPLLVLAGLLLARRFK